MQHSCNCPYLHAEQMSLGNGWSGRSTLWSKNQGKVNNDFLRVEHSSILPQPQSTEWHIVHSANFGDVKLKRFWNIPLRLLLLELLIQGTQTTIASNQWAIDDDDNVSGGWRQLCPSTTQGCSHLGHRLCRRIWWAWLCAWGSLYIRWAFVELCTMQGTLLMHQSFILPVQ